MKHGKNYRAIADTIEIGKEYAFEEALALLQAKPVAKFDESVEIHVRLSIDPKKTDQQVRATVALPEGTGKTKRVAVVTSTKEKEAKDAGADLVGGQELIDDIKSGKLVPGAQFDVLLATPEMMPKLAPAAKILGPRGMMPSPKTETVTPKIAETVEMMKKGKKVSFKSDDGGSIHQIIGKLSFSSESLRKNYDVLLDAVGKAKPASVKGKLIVSVSVCSTMGPSVRVAL